MSYELDPKAAFLFDGSRWTFKRDPMLVDVHPSVKRPGFFYVQIINMETWDALDTINPAKPWWCARALAKHGVDIDDRDCWVASPFLAESGDNHSSPYAGSIIYAIQCGEFVKLGTTGNLEGRLDALQCGNPYELSVIAFWPGGVKEEQDIHRRFAHLRVRREWFSISPELLAFIEENATCKA